MYLFVIWLYFAWLDARCPCAPAAKLQTMLLHLDQSHVSSAAWHRVIFLAAQSSQTMSIHFVFGLLLVHLLCIFPCSIIWGSLMLLYESYCKGKRSIAVRKKPHRYGNSRAIWDHTVLPATWQRWHSCLYPSRSWYSIKRPRRDARLSWPSWLVTARDGIPARRRSPVPVVTGPDVR